VLAGTAGLTKSGAGTATLSGTNSYSGGTTVTGGDLYASQANALGDATGAVTVNGGTLWVNANITRTGTVTVNGADLGGNGSTLTNNGGGFVLTGSYAAAGNLVLAGSGGLTASSADARLWAQATYSGATTVTSGTLNICGAGGIPTASPVSIASGAAVNLTSYYAATDGNRTIGGLTGNGVLYGGGGTVTVNKTSGTDTFSGDIQGAQGFIKAGSGTLILAGASTYAGATLVSGGKLLVNGNNSSATGAVTVDGGATLGGSGSIGGATTVNGTLSPGNSPGVLSIASLVLGGSSTSLFEIGGTSRGTAYDGVDITSGGLTYGGALSLAFTSTFGDNTTFNLFDFAGALSGDFSSVTATGLYGSLTFTNDGFGVWTSGSTSVAGQTITFTQSTGDLAIVPEPGALTLAGLGITAAAWAFRRRT
jgi:autotransporter-associated beta strand protein